MKGSNMLATFILLIVVTTIVGIPILFWGGGGGGGGRGQNLVHIQKIGVLRLSFLEVHILSTTCQKAFILAP